MVGPLFNWRDLRGPLTRGVPTRKHFAVHFVLKDHDATVLGAVHHKCFAGVKRDRLAVSREACHEIGSSSNRHWPARKVIAGLEDRVIGQRIEIMFAIKQPGQAVEDLRRRDSGLQRRDTGAFPSRLLSANYRTPRRAGATRARCQTVIVVFRHVWTGGDAAVSAPSASGAAG
jgi:hypothetical protein